MSGVKIKLEVEAHEDVCYPTVTVVHTKKVEIVSKPQEPIQLELKKDEPKEVQPQVQPVVLADVVNKIDESDSERKQRGWGKWCSRLCTVMVAIVAIIAVVLVGLRLAGFRTFTVMSGSMSPEYPVGSLIYVKPVDYKSLKVGDVISYVANEDNTVVTHRIADIEIDENDSSVWRFKTKGDANATADGKLVHYKNVLGTPIVSVPVIGYFAHNIQQPPGIYIALVVGTLLLAWTFLPGTLEERRKTARKSIA